MDEWMNEWCAQRSTAQRSAATRSAAQTRAHALRTHSTATFHSTSAWFSVRKGLARRRSFWHEFLAEEGQQRLRGVWVYVGPSCGGCVSTPRAGVRHRPSSTEGLRRAIFSTRAKGPHAPPHTHRERAAPLQHASPSHKHTQTATAHVTSLVHKRCVQSAARDAHRRKAQRSTARARDTCTTYTTVHTPAPVSCTVVPFSSRAPHRSCVLPRSRRFLLWRLWLVQLLAAVVLQRLLHSRSFAARTAASEG